MINSVVLLAMLLVRLAGNRLPLNTAPLFTHPDGTPCREPCLFGIRPGETDGQTAAIVLRSHPLTRDFQIIGTDPYRIEADSDRIMMISFNEGVDGLVDEITLATYVRYGEHGGSNIPLPPSGVLGDVLSLFGSPNFVQLARGGDPLLIYADAKVSTSIRRAGITDQRLSLLTPVSRLTFYRLEKCTESSFDFVFLRWLGVVSFRRYAFADTIEYPIRRINSAGTSFAPCLR